MPRNLQRQAGLATATRTDQGDQTRAGDARDKMRELLLTADEAAEYERKVVAHRGFSAHDDLPGVTIAHLLYKNLIVRATAIYRWLEATRIAADSPLWLAAPDLCDRER